jgi:hypothetical protein
MKEDDADLQIRIREALQQRAQSLDEPTLARLQAGRKRALAGLGHAPRFGWSGFDRWRPLSLALAASLLVAVILLSPRGEGPVQAPQLVSDAVILAYDEGLDLYDELDFYLWLEAESS